MSVPFPSYLGEREECPSMVQQGAHGCQPPQLPVGGLPFREVQDGHISPPPATCYWDYVLDELTSAQSYRGARFCVGLGAAENTGPPGTGASCDESSGRPRVASASLPNASLLMWGCH